MKEKKCFAAWQLPVCPAWPWRAGEMRCFPKRCLQPLFSRRSEEVAFRMHLTPGCWGGAALAGHCGAHRAADLPCGAGGCEGVLHLAPRGHPSLGCLWALRAPGALEKQVPEHPKNGFSTLIPFKWTRNLLPGLQPLQALV